MSMRTLESTPLPTPDPFVDAPSAWPVADAPREHRARPAVHRRRRLRRGRDESTAESRAATGTLGSAARRPRTASAVRPDAPQTDAMHDATRTEGEVTRLLGEIQARPNAQSELLDLVYDELRALATRRMRSERGSHTLEATALVHEAWMRLSGPGAGFEGRAHFFGAAAEAMRRILVDHARKRDSLKRGGDRQRAQLEDVAPATTEEPGRLLALDEALTILEREDARAAEVVKLRFFTGLDVATVAETLEISNRTVIREWTYARARLQELLGPDAPTDLPASPTSPAPAPAQSSAPASPGTLPDR